MSHSTSAEVTRQRILDAALSELTEKDVGAFNLESVAARADLDPMTVRGYWANSNAMYSAALNAWFDRNMPVPDTGTLRGDWVAFARSYVAAFNSPTGRRVMGAVIASPRDWDVSGLRETFQLSRTARVGEMVRRAIDRGECAEGIDPDLVADFLRTGMSMPMSLRGEPLSESHAERVIDLLLNGVLRRRPLPRE